MSRANSAMVNSTQCGPHPRVRDAVRRHLARESAQPESAHVTSALARLLAAHAHDPRPLLLDSGCGDGSSSRELALRHRACLAVGVDRSAVRLRGCLDDSVHGERDGALFLRTDAAALWRAMRRAGLRVARHLLLYPNPWPKPAHYLRRWPAHPAFADLLALGGTLELRCNWRAYADEMVAALQIAGFDARVEAIAEDEPPLSPFERKYRASGHALWRVAADLDRVHRGAATARPCRSRAPGGRTGLRA